MVVKKSIGILVLPIGLLRSSRLQESFSQGFKMWLTNGHRFGLV
jgi:hypothetical protein